MSLSCPTNSAGINPAARAPNGAARGTAAAVLVWLVTLGLGLGALWRFGFTAGPARETPARWPEESRILRSSDRPTLAVFLHPHCPCSRATLGELAGAIRQGAGQLSVHVVFWKPAGATDSWVDGELWRTAGAVPGASLRTDEDGAEARIFGAGTSGHAVLFDRAGTLTFSGGITISRGHAGPSPGRDAVENLIRGEPVGRARTPVFGCPLFTPPPREGGRL